MALTRVTGLGTDINLSGNLTTESLQTSVVRVGTSVTISTGVITATSYEGSGSSLDGIDATSLKDSQGNTKLQANESGLVITGIATGNLSGTATTATNALNVKDTAGNIRITTNNAGMVITGIATVQTGKLMVGNAYVDSTAVGIGSTTTTGRNAGIGTLIGSMIFNTTSQTVQLYDGVGWIEVSNRVNGHTASGGVVYDYASGDDFYRTHTFTTSGSFVISELSNTYPAHVEYLVVGAGGGGGYESGGGAGGFRTSATGDTPGGPGASSAEVQHPVSASSYTVTIGAGGVGNNNTGTQISGSHSQFDTIRSEGGGAGSNTSNSGLTGGSGGGGYSNSGTASGIGAGGAGNRQAGTSTPAPNQGYPGGNNAGGGGGAGSAGTPSGSPWTGGTNGAGGNGLRSTITGPAYLIGTPGPGGTGGYLAGGGAGAWSSGTGGPGGYGGGGTGDPGLDNTDGTQATGGGGGGSWNKSGANGGSGLVVVRYKIGSQQTATAKATGGNISFANGKTIHQFLTSGTFNITDNSLSTVECLVIGAGGGGGGGYQAGGGGAGLLHYKTGHPVNPATPYPVTIGSGGKGGRFGPAPGPEVAGRQGSDSVFAGLTATGGGYGNSYWPAPGANGGGPGGSAGGAGCNPGAGSARAGDGDSGHPGGIDVVSPANGWGNDGGASGPYGSPYAGGGGGGAAAVGAGGGPGTGAGGDGARYTIADNNTAVYYAGGGGGGGWNPGGTPSAGGQGGGGTGGNYGPSAPLHVATVAGTVNTGGGGGGGGGTGGAPEGGPTTSVGQPGGPGIVIIAYPT